MEHTEGQKAKKQYPYACAVRRKPYLSREVRDKMAIRRSEKSLAQAAFVPLGNDIHEWNFQPLAVRTHAILMSFKQADDGGKNNPNAGPYEYFNATKRQERMCRKRRRGWA